MHKEIHGSLEKRRIKLERLLGDPKVMKHTEIHERNNEVQDNID